MNFAQTLPWWAALPVAFLLVLGGLIAVIGTLGMFRLKSFYQRIHGPAITVTLGTGCILVASMLYFSVAQSRLVIHELLIAASSEPPIRVRAWTGEEWGPPDAAATLVLADAQDVALRLHGGVSVRVNGVDDERGIDDHRLPPRSPARDSCASSIAARTASRSSSVTPGRPCRRSAVRASASWRRRYLAWAPIASRR